MLDRRGKRAVQQIISPLADAESDMPLYLAFLYPYSSKTFLECPSPFPALNGELRFWKVDTVKEKAA